MKPSVFRLSRKVKKQRASGIRQSAFGKKTHPKCQLPNAEGLLAWYDQHRRILPWRALPGQKPDPYNVWLSEIMLQQTTVAAVAPYYQKFLKRWPTIQQLAAAALDDVLQMWAGLGYYRRAHSLHACAQRICLDHKGQFPQDEKELMKLPGFGAYTTAAVRTIAFNQPANVVDGNVERVMARIFAVTTPLPKAKKELTEHAAALLPNNRYGDYAQALMDLGATICTPRNPKCDVCPWEKSCQAHKKGIEGSLPRKLKAKAKPVRRAIAFVALNKKGQILLRQRGARGLLGGMMEIPSSEWIEGKMPSLAGVQKEAPVKGKWRMLPGQISHVFSHFELQLSVAVRVSSSASRGTWVDVETLRQQALPSVMHKIVRHALNKL